METNFLLTIRKKNIQIYIFICDVFKENIVVPKLFWTLKRGLIRYSWSIFINDSYIAIYNLPLKNNIHLRWILN